MRTRSSNSVARSPTLCRPVASRLASYADWATRRSGLIPIGSAHAGKPAPRPSSHVSTPDRILFINGSHPGDERLRFHRSSRQAEATCREPISTLSPQVTALFQLFDQKVTLAKLFPVRNSYGIEPNARTGACLLTSSLRRGCRTSGNQRCVQAVQDLQHRFLV